MTKQWILFMILAVALSGCTDTNTAPVADTPVIEPTPVPIATQAFPVQEPTTVYVEIKGSTFIPLELNITNGTTVRWTNLDSVRYVLNVRGSQSPPLNKRDTWNFTFNKTGTYEYNSSSHPSMKHGWIVVE
jgi:plastocyanin